MALTTITGSPFSRVLGMGAALPSRVVDNEELTTFIETSDAWIRQRTGITERRWVTEGEDLRSLSRDASARALEASGIAAGAIDCVIVATVTHLLQMPALAPLLAHDLGCEDAAAYDVSAACAGFSYALAQADALVRAGSATHVLVVGAETMSTLLDTADRSTAFLFADAAGAAVVGPSDTPGIGPVVWGSDGAQADVISMTKPWDEAAAVGELSRITMEGQPVFRWATGFIADASRRVLDASGLAPEELDVFVPHQANNRITDSMLRHLTLPDTVKVARSIVHCGNTSAASIPVALAEMIASGEAHSGDTALLIGFGAGLVYAGQVIIVP